MNDNFTYTMSNTRMEFEFEDACYLVVVSIVENVLNYLEIYFQMQSRITVLHLLCLEVTLRPVS
jgi:hypothetical protein